MLHPTKTAIAHQLNALKRTFENETNGIAKDSPAYDRAKTTYDATVKSLKAQVPAEEWDPSEDVHTYSDAETITANS